MDKRSAIVCPGCGAEFTPKRKDSWTCTRRCWYIARGSLLREPVELRVCALPSCGVTFQPRRPIEECCSEGHGRRFWKIKAKAAGIYSNGNPDTRRRALRVRTQQRRAALRDPHAEAIDRDAIGDRDGWRCGLCCKRVDKILTYPHPMSPSLDHIQPLSLGGKHAKANVQITHLRCNVVKSNRTAGEQLLLFG